MGVKMEKLHAEKGFLQKTNVENYEVFWCQNLTLVCTWGRIWYWWMFLLDSLDSICSWDLWCFVTSMSGWPVSQGVLYIKLKRKKEDGMKIQKHIPKNTKTCSHTHSQHKYTIRPTLLRCFGGKPGCLLTAARSHWVDEVWHLIRLGSGLCKCFWPSVSHSASSTRT